MAIRRDAGLHGYERALHRAGFDVVAGADEAGRGACAGPLVVAAAILPTGRSAEIDELGDSKLLTSACRDRVYARVMRRAVATSVVVVSPQDVDRFGLHVMNLRAMRQAVRRLSVPAAYVLTDGFPLAGLDVPTLAVWKGDRVAACVAAASVVAKVTRDRLMNELDREHPGYGLAVHKGYCTRAHDDALERLGPTPVHRFSYVNVARWADVGVPLRTRVRLGVTSDAPLPRQGERTGHNDDIARDALTA